MPRTLSRWAGSLALIVGLSGLSAPAFADPIYLEHHHGYQSSPYGYGAGRGRDHYYGPGYGGRVYAVPVYRHHHHCRDVVVHTWHGHHLRRVCG